MVAGKGDRKWEGSVEQGGRAGGRIVVSLPCSVKRTFVSICVLEEIKVSTGRDSRTVTLFSGKCRGPCSPTSCLLLSWVSEG